MAAVHGAGVALCGAEQQFAVVESHVPVARCGNVLISCADNFPEEEREM